MSVLFIANQVPKPRYLTPIEMQPMSLRCADLSFFILLLSSKQRLDEAELGGSNVESIDIGSQAGESLLGAVRAVWR